MHVTASSKPAMYANLFGILALGRTCTLSHPWICPMVYDTVTHKVNNESALQEWALYRLMFFIMRSLFARNN